jgi:hypothetical protein
MTVGRILGNGKDLGSGFALATAPSGFTRVIVTAKHVVDGQAATALQFALAIGATIPVERVVPDETLDIAILYAGEDVAGGLATSEAVDEARWKVLAQPRGNDPMLKGTIDAARWRVSTRAGKEIAVLQLKVHEQLDDYKGYSGSAVILDAPSGGVIGVLIEQLLSRLTGTLGQAQAATNVLYAIPIQDILVRFELPNVPTAPAATTNSVDKKPKLDARRAEAQLKKLQARAMALNRSLASIAEQSNTGLLEPGRAEFMKNNLNQQRTEILQEAARMLEGLDGEYDSILLDAAAGEPEDALMERLTALAKLQGFSQGIITSLERQQGTLLFWLLEIGVQLVKRAKEGGP